MLKLICVVLAFLAIGAVADDIDLTGETFQETVDGNDFVLIMFYAPWCGHCKSLKPKFTEAATKVKGKYVLAKVDCTEDANKDICEDHGVRGYPTLVFYKKGAKQEYNGPRETDGIINWLDKKSGPAVRELADAAAVKEFTADGAAVVFYGEASGDAYEAFDKAANSADMDDFKFGSTSDGEAAGTVKFFRGDVGDDLTTTDTSDLIDWVFSNSFPVVGQISGENYMKYAKLGKPLYMLFADPEDYESKGLEAAMTAGAEAATDSKFGWIDAVRFQAQVKAFGCSGDVLPCLTRIDSFEKDMKPIAFEQEITADSIKEFVAGVASGKYQYVPKSEDIPEDNDGPVTTIVGKNFEAIVNDESKDVLLEFYAPWCGHCKSLAPTWEKLGEAFGSADNIVIAKIDATANDYEAHAEVRGFPTILFYPAGDKTNPVSYSGARELADLVAWVKEHATVDFDKEAVTHDEL